MIAIGVDLGTSGVRAAALTQAGDVIGMARASYGDDPGASARPEAWWSATETAVLSLVETLARDGRDISSVAGICVDGTSGTLVLADAALRPVGRALMYNAGGFAAEAERIAAAAPPRHIARGAGSGLARALRLHAEAAGQDVAHLLHQADFVEAQLTGRGGRTDFNNALKTGLDPETGAWPDWIADLDFPVAALPVAHAPGTAIGPLAEGVAARLGLAPTVSVHVGTTDSIAAFLASAPREPGAAVTSLGTTLAIKLYAPTRIDAPEMGLYSHRMADGWLVGGASNTGAGVLRHFFSVEELEALSTEIDPDVASELDYYPLLRPGERFPVNDPELAPRLTPRPDNDAAFLHGMLESMARIEKRSYDTLVDLGAPRPERIITSGGGAANMTWQRIRSRVLGLPVEQAAIPEACVGTASLVFG